MLNRALFTIPCAPNHRLLVPTPTEPESLTGKDVGTLGRTRWRGCVP